MCCDIIVLWYHCAVEMKCSSDADLKYLRLCTCRWTRLVSFLRQLKPSQVVNCSLSLPFLVSFQLTCVHMRGRPMLTRQLLCEHAEKITAAIILRKMHNQ